MKIKKYKNSNSTAIVLILILTMSMLSIGLPSAKAHTPPWSIATYVYVDASPNPVGVNQNVLVHVWLSECPPTAIGPYGDRWHGLKVEVTKPDGTKQILGPFSTDAVGGAWTTFTPTVTGNYAFLGIFPGQTLAGENPDTNVHPGDSNTPAGREIYVGDYYEPSQSSVYSLTVQDKPIGSYPDNPLPNTYWTRPINAQNRDWWSISGNWLYPPSRTVAGVALYTTAPDSAHILWRKQIDMGGLVGGEYGAHSFHTGAAYEAYWNPPVIIAGTLYYNKYPDDIKNTGEYRAQGPKPGVVAVDLRTGQEVWYKPDMPRISFGQVYYYASVNQNGAFAYLWAVNGTSLISYEALTGDKVCTITNVPSGTQVFGVNGEILRYTLNTATHRLTLWNSTAMPELLGGLDYYAGMWRPHGKTVDAKTGYMWNVSIPNDLVGTINYVLLDENGKPDRILGSNGLNTPGYTGDVDNFTLWSLNLKLGQEGQLLWSKFYTAPYRNVIMTMAQCPASVKEGIFTLYCAETREWFGYNLNTGEKVWGPSEQQGAWDIFYETSGAIAYGKLYSAGVAGIIYCYNLQTGKRLWATPASDPTWEAMYSSNYPLRLALIADGKVYADSTEHSPNNPMARGAPIICIDAETGAPIWRIPIYRQAWGGGPAVADGIIIEESSYDNSIYAIGKGQSETTITASPKVIAKGSSTLVEGTVTDQSPGQTCLGIPAAGTPAISDESMSAWMEYLYQQQPLPANATGVRVHITAYDPNGNFQDIGTTTTDTNGKYGIAWTPQIEGTYHLTATFEGSNSYYSSLDTTYLAVGSAPSPAPATATSAPTATPSAAAATTAPVTATPSEVPTSRSGAGFGTEYYIAIAAAVSVIVLLAIAYVLKRRK
jgi:outer membrane protein assembly factor BamB